MPPTPAARSYALCVQVRVLDDIILDLANDKNVDLGGRGCASVEGRCVREGFNADS